MTRDGNGNNSLSPSLEAYLGNVDAFLRYRERLGAGWIWDNCLELGLGWDRVQSRNLLNLIGYQFFHSRSNYFSSCNFSRTIKRKGLNVSRLVNYEDK